MKLIPLHDRVLVRRDPPRMTHGALILTEGVRALERRSKDGNPSTVIAVGPGRLLDDGTRVPPTLKPGDRVFLGFHPGPDAGPDLPDHNLPREKDIQGRITEE